MLSIRHYLRVSGAVLGTLVLGTVGTALAADGNNGNDPSHIVFIRGAQENLLRTAITLPLYQGTGPGGQTIYYVVTDASTKEWANRLGVNYAPKLANAVTIPPSSAVMHVTVNNHGVINFPATVTFNGEGSHSLKPNAAFVPIPLPAADSTAPDNVLPPDHPSDGSTGDALYSPLIQMPDGAVLDASQVMNVLGTHIGIADKVVTIDPVGGTVTYKETVGFFNGRPVHYISLDGSQVGPAAFEDVTLALNLNAVPGLGNEGPASGREVITAFANGQIGPTNPNRQGLSSVILDGLNPLNLVDALPDDNSPHSAYSPLWDVHIVAWANPANAVLVTSNADVRALALSNTLVSGTPNGPDSTGIPGAANAIANCPIMSFDAG